ncbi:MAG: RagB/SusD family nutrient uptake outer membrane protein [Pedobacter sp.]|nr:RagB/SusD family nutrient uptake outer membrane protein [Chitinophagaceae bacterium]
MKKYFQFLFQGRVILMMLTVVTLASSCSKFLDPKPGDVVLESEFPKDYWDAEFMLRGAYGALRPLVNHQVAVGEMRADWVTPGSGADADFKELAYNQVSNTNRFTDWQPFYELINRANYAIANIPRVAISANYFSETIKNRYIGEARYLRCYGYMQLIKNFGKVPFIWSTVDDISKVDTLFNIAPSSEDLILDSLEADLKLSFAACDIIGQVPNSFDAGFRQSQEQTVMRVRKQAVAGLLAEVYLWRNKYTQAVKACEDFFNTGVDNGQAAGGSGWFNNFSLGVDASGNSTGALFGALFRVKYDFNARQTNDLQMYTSNNPDDGGKYMMAPSLRALKTYNPYYPDSLPGNPSGSTVVNNLYGDEVRRGFGKSYVGSAPFYNIVKSTPVIWKFIGLATVAPSTIGLPQTLRGPYQSDYHFHIIRGADIYLMWAEAANRNGDKATALLRINAVRGNAEMPSSSTVNRFNDTISTGSSTEKIENYILREHGLELGFEGRRWYTLIRMARHRGTPSSPDVSFVTNPVIDRMAQNGESVAKRAEVTAVLADPKNWYLPYNAAQVRLNPKLVK